MAKYLIKTGNITTDVLPSIPVKLMEKGVDPDSSDGMFVDYKNGYEAYSVTIYSKSDLPIFSVETVYKDKGE